MRDRVREGTSTSYDPVPRSSGQYNEPDERETRSSEVGRVPTHLQSVCERVVYRDSILNYDLA